MSGLQSAGVGNQSFEFKFSCYNFLSPIRVPHSKA